MNKEQDKMLKRNKSMIKLMKMAKESGILKERKRIVKLFKFEIDSRVTSYETLVKLDKLKRDANKR